MEDNIVKVSSLPKVIYRFNPIPFKIPIMVLEKIGKSILKLIWNLKGP